MNRLTIWIIHAAGMAFAMWAYNLSGLSATQSSIGAASVLLIHWGSNRGKS